MSKIEVIDHPDHPERYQITRFEPPRLLVHVLRSGTEIVQNIPQREWNEWANEENYG